MAHCTPEQLALAALSEPLPAGDAEHLTGCARCREEVASLRRGVEALAVPELARPAVPVAPPPSVWAAIAAQTGVQAAPRPDAVAAAADHGVDPPAAGHPDAGHPAAGHPAAGDPAADAPLAEVVPFRPRRSRLLIAAAAALVVGAGIGGGAVALNRSGGDADGGDGGGGGTVVAATRLTPLGGADASGEASVVDRRGGQVLEVDLDAPAPAVGYYEVWLIDQGIQGMVPVGVVHAGRTDLPLPADLDLGEFPVVDVSVEQLDGNPAHSGDSVARGQLPS